MNLRLLLPQLHGTLVQMSKRKSDRGRLKATGKERGKARKGERERVSERVSASKRQSRKKKEKKSKFAYKLPKKERCNSFDPNHLIQAMKQKKQKGKKTNFS